MQPVGNRHGVGGRRPRLVGAIFLVWVDVAARTILAPEDLPIGIITGLIGGVFFVRLMRRRLG